MAIHKIRNRSGAEMFVRVPGRGLDAKTFQRRVAQGVYEVIELDALDGWEGKDGKTVPEPTSAEPAGEPTEPNTDDTDRIAAVLAGNVGEVIAHAQENTGDVAALLEAEQAAAEPRKTVVDQLTAMQAG